MTFSFLLPEFVTGLINASISMYIGPQINKDFFTSETEIIVNRTGYVEISPGLFFVAEDYFKTFSSQYANIRILDKIWLYKKDLFLIKVMNKI